MALNISWGNSLETLADSLFEKMGEQEPLGIEDIFARRDCIVIPNRIQQSWLQQRFLYDAPRTTIPHVLSNCDFPLLNLFVTDWLNRMGQPEVGKTRPDPENHLFSVKSMRWRIFSILLSSTLEEEFAPLKHYVIEQKAAKPDPRKCFKLAGRLASLMDQYATYRPQMLIDWEKGVDSFTNKDTAWEPALWRKLTDKQRDKTYLATYLRMTTDLGNCGIEKTFRRIFVFAPSMLPGVHLAFFRSLGNILPVDFYMFNPSPSTDWFDRDSERQCLANHIPLERSNDEEGLFDKQHPLLSAYARGSRDLVAGTIDLTEGQVDNLFPPLSPPQTVLEQLQQTLIQCDGSLNQINAQIEAPDPSIQIHQCHGMMREVEILRDQILKCFEVMPHLQPRHIQVQVVDVNAYAPYIEAVFATLNPNDPDAIPIVLADRVATGESPVAEAFRQLLELSDSRFTAPEVMDLLRCESIAKTFGFEPADVDQMADWLNQAGVRWGRDQAHRTHASDAKFAEQTSWKHGIDRLLLGYVLGHEFSGTTQNGIIPCDCAEGDGAVRLGQMVQFYDKLTAFADYGQTQHTVSEWGDRLENLVDDFFVSDNTTFMEVAILKSAIQLLRTTIQAADFSGEVPLAVIRDFLSGHLGETEGGTDLNRNAVVFSSLRPGSSAPRRVQCLLGMGDSLFPRTTSRPSYDLLRDTRKMGDRSPTIEDRMAFLEVILNARERLLIFYPAFSEEDNTESCESVVVRELVEYLKGRFGETSIRPTRHRLQAFHPSYFGGDSKQTDLFSYSVSNWAAARKWREQQAPRTREDPETKIPKPVAPATALEGQTPIVVQLEDLIRFFKNPAKQFYREILGVDLEPKGEVALADTETFKPGHLDEFKVRQKMIAALVSSASNSTLEFLRDEFIANGTIPLAASGARWFEATQANLSAVLDSSWEKIGTLRTALEDCSRATPRELEITVTVDGRVVQLRGTIPITPENRIFSFRCATPKAEVRLETWLTHLLARTANLPVWSVIAQGKDSKKIKEKGKFSVYCFADLKSADGSVPEAHKWLTTYLQIYLNGLCHIPPYTPASALAYAETKRDKERTQPPLPEEQIVASALEVARKKWTSGYKQTAYDGDRDPYFLAAHGKDGPFRDSRFIQLAEQIMSPMLQSQEQLKPEGN